MIRYYQCHCTYEYNEQLKLNAALFKTQIELQLRNFYFCLFVVNFHQQWFPVVVQFLNLVFNVRILERLEKSQKLKSKQY